MRLFSNVWSENTALFERLMEIHSKSPKLYYGFKAMIMIVIFRVCMWRTFMQQLFYLFFFFFFFFFLQFRVRQVMPIQHYLIFWLEWVKPYNVQLIGFTCRIVIVWKDFCWNIMSKCIKWRVWIQKPINANFKVFKVSQSSNRAK